MAELRPVYYDLTNNQLKVPNASDTIFSAPDITFNTIAELKAFDIYNSTGTKTAEVLGYYTSGDGGGGKFYWESTATDVDNGGTNIRPDNYTTYNQGVWKRPVKARYDIKEFGGNGDNATDNTLVLTNINSSGVSFIVSEGQYVINTSVNITVPEVEFAFNSAFVIASSQTVDFSMDTNVVAGNYEIFKGDGVVDTKSTVLALPQWWGAVGIKGGWSGDKTVIANATDDTTALQKCFNQADSIYFNDNFKFTQKLTIPEFKNLYGRSRRAFGLVGYGANTVSWTDNICIETENYPLNYWRCEDIQFSLVDVDDYNVTGFKFGSYETSIIRNLSFDGVDCNLATWLDMNGGPCLIENVNIGYESGFAFSDYWLKLGSVTRTGATKYHNWNMSTSAATIAATSPTATMTFTAGAGSDGNITIVYNGTDGDSIDVALTSASHSTASLVAAEVASFINDKIGLEASASTNTVTFTARQKGTKDVGSAITFTDTDTTGVTVSTSPVTMAGGSNGLPKGILVSGSGQTVLDTFFLETAPTGGDIASLTIKPDTGGVKITNGTLTTGKTSPNEALAFELIMSQYGQWEIDNVIVGKAISGSKGFDNILRVVQPSKSTVIRTYTSEEFSSIDEKDIIHIHKLDRSKIVQDTRSLFGGHTFSHSGFVDSGSGLANSATFEVLQPPHFLDLKSNINGSVSIAVRVVGRPATPQANAVSAYAIVDCNIYSGSFVQTTNYIYGSGDFTIDVNTTTGKLRIQNVNGVALFDVVYSVEYMGSNFLIGMEDQ